MGSMSQPVGNNFRLILASAAADEVGCPGVAQA
jgi:hypothetical protein